MLISLLDLSRNLSSPTTAVRGLSAMLLIEGLQQEAQRALQEVIHLLHPEDASRFRHVSLAASTTQNVSHSLVTELFFKPVIGNTNMLHLLTDMLFVQWDYREKVVFQTDCFPLGTLYYSHNVLFTVDFIFLKCCFFGSVSYLSHVRWP